MCERASTAQIKFIKHSSSNCRYQSFAFNMDKQVTKMYTAHARVAHVLQSINTFNQFAYITNTHTETYFDFVHYRPSTKSIVIILCGAINTVRSVTRIAWNFNWNSILTHSKLNQPLLLSSMEWMTHIVHSTVLLKQCDMKSGWIVSNQRNAPGKMSFMNLRNRFVWK